MSNYYVHDGVDLRVQVAGCPRRLFGNSKAILGVRIKLNPTATWF